MSAPHRTVTLSTTQLQSIENRLFFLAEVLQHDPSLEAHHVEGLADLLRAIGTDVWALHEHEDELVPRVVKR